MALSKQTLIKKFRTAETLNGMGTFHFPRLREVFEEVSEKSRIKHVVAHGGSRNYDVYLLPPQIASKLKFPEDTPSEKITISDLWLNSHFRLCAVESGKVLTVTRRTGRGQYKEISIVSAPMVMESFF